MSAPQGCHVPLMPFNIIRHARSMDTYAASRLASVQQVPIRGPLSHNCTSRCKGIPIEPDSASVHTMHSLLLSQNAIPSVVHAASARQYRQSLIRPRLFTALCAANGPAPTSSNGSRPDAPEPDDPVAAMMWAAQQDGVQVLFDEDDEDADYDDILDDLEDPWMRNPSRKQCCCLSSRLSQGLRGTHRPGDS